MKKLFAFLTTALFGLRLLAQVVPGAAAPMYAPNTAKGTNVTVLGSGAIQTNLQEFLSRNVHALDFMSAAQKADVKAGTGALDVSSALTAAITYAKTLPAPHLILPAGKMNLGTAKVVFDLPDNSTLDCYGTMVSMATGGAAVQIGAASRVTTGLKVSGLVLTRSTYDQSAGSIGVLVKDCVYSQVYIRSISGFQEGLQVKGSTGAQSNVSFFLGQIYDNKTNIHLTATGSGWCNDNSFYGGFLTHSSSYPNTVAGYHLVIDDFAGSPLNNNRFFGIDFEAVKPGIVAARVGGQYNLIFQPRMENSALPATITGSVTTGGVMTVSTTGTYLLPGMYVSGTGIPPGAAITSQLTGTTGSTGTYQLSLNPGSAVSSESITINYVVFFTSNSIKCGLVGLGYGVANANVVDLGLGNYWQAQEGLHLAGGAGPVLSLQSTSSGTVHLVSVKNPSGVEQGYLDGTGAANLNSAYVNNGLRWSTTSGTYTDRGLFVGSGSPNSVVTAQMGSIYLNTAGGTTTTLWVKESGANTNTGWVAK